MDSSPPSIGTMAIERSHVNSERVRRQGLASKDFDMDVALELAYVIQVMDHVLAGNHYMRSY